MNRAAPDFTKPFFEETLVRLYGADPRSMKRQRQRYKELYAGFCRAFSREDGHFFSSPGRSEIGGNHTDHNKGKVLAAAVTLDMLAVAAKTDDGVITLHSKGYDAPFIVDTRQLSRVPGEEGTSRALIRGILFKMREQGFKIGGFAAVMESDVLSGSGLSSSAAFEVLIATILDGLYNEGNMPPLVKAKICAFAENEYFGKPSGLMDQCASAAGGFLKIDFKDEEPKTWPLSMDFEGHGMKVVVLATKSSHDDLTPEYAAIPGEMGQVAAFFKKRVLREVDEGLFYGSIAKLQERVSDRAILRAMHYFEENRRVDLEAAAIENGDMQAFLRLVTESGLSSWRLLQNLYVGGSADQSLALACALSEKILGTEGACRVHGGGFAGTILAFVPDHLLNSYTAQMNEVFGEGACTVLGIRGPGAIMLDI